MASKHLKKENTPAPSQKHIKKEPAPAEKHAAKEAGPPKEAPAPKKAAPKAETKPAAQSSQKADKSAPAGPPQKGEKLLKIHRFTKEDIAAGPDEPPQGGKRLREPEPLHEEPGTKAVRFHRDRPQKTPEEKAQAMSRRDAVGAIISLAAALIMLAAAVVIWIYRDRFDPDGLIITADSAAVAEEEYIFDAGSGQAFAAAGKGLAVANGTGLELLDGEGTAVTSMVMQMENPAATGCENYAVFYDMGGMRLAVADFEGNIQELPVQGEIISAAVSDAGYLAVTTKCTGYRGLVTVYDPMLEVIYEWYSSSAWVISAMVSPDGRKLAVLSYTASGSEVRFFDLDSDEQKGAFSVSDTVLLDLHWFSSSQLCAFSTSEVLFFNSKGDWQNTYSFAGQYLTGYTFSGDGYAAFALSPYRAGTTATLVSLDPTGAVLGTAEVDSGIVCLNASGSEILLLCSDGATLYSSALNERGTLTGLPGFKYGLLRDRGEALLIAANYADVYRF